MQAVLQWRRTQLPVLAVSPSESKESLSGTVTGDLSGLRTTKAIYDRDFLSKYVWWHRYTTMTWTSNHCSVQESKTPCISLCATAGVRKDLILNEPNSLLRHTYVSTV